MTYTRTGDGGTTLTASGERVAKDDLRIEACGAADELCAHIGLLAEYAKALDAAIASELKAVQHSLFTVQLLLSAYPAIYNEEQRLSTLHNDTQHLEHQIDLMEPQLPEIDSFVVPGGSVAAAQTHIARTVCRRAERNLVALMTATRQYNNTLIAYINRLSDYLFVLSRYMLHIEGVADDCMTAF